MHGRDRVAGINRTLEGVLAVDSDNVRNLCNIQQRRDPRQYVLPGCRRRRQHVTVILRYAGDQDGQRLCQGMLITRVVDQQHLAHAVNLCARFGYRTAVLSRHEQMRFA